MRDRWKDEKKILSEAEKNYPSAMKIIDYRGERENFSEESRNNSSATRSKGKRGERTLN